MRQITEKEAMQGLLQGDEIWYVINDGDCGCDGDENGNAECQLPENAEKPEFWCKSTIDPYDYTLGEVLEGLGLHSYWIEE